MKTFDTSTLNNFHAGDLNQPWADTWDDAKQQRLEGDRKHTRTATLRTFTDFRTNADAYRHLATLPGPGQTHHMMISGRYCMWDIVPAIVDLLAPATIAHLQLSTLSFSERNAGELLGLIQGGKIERVSLLISHYFKHTSRELYDLLIPKLTAPHRSHAMRTHAKLILIEASDGTKYAASGSPNLRSSQNMEALDLTNDPDLHDFYADIITELIDKA